MRPKKIHKEARFLSLAECRTLLQYSANRLYAPAVWLGILAGLRVGESQALIWENVDLEAGILHVRKTYVRKKHTIQDYPKGKAWRSVPLVPELRHFLAKLRAQSDGGPTTFVVQGETGGMLSYHTFQKALTRLYKAGVNGISSHGLRHSASGVFRAVGAGKEELGQLYGHVSPTTTAVYMHDRGERLRSFANVVEMFPNCAQIDVLEKTRKREEGSGV